LFFFFLIFFNLKKMKPVSPLVVSFVLVCTLFCVNHFFFGIASVSGYSSSLPTTENAALVFPLVSGLVGFIVGVWFLGSLHGEGDHHPIYFPISMVLAAVLELVTMSLWAYLADQYSQSSASIILYILTAATDVVGWTTVAVLLFMSGHHHHHADGNYSSV
jgi:NAD/NADP transhydrogenase beta subunit